MASVQQGEKQLFEKFWRGTFKAVATPRPGSVIVASITSRKPLASTEALSCLPLPTDNKHPEEPCRTQETSSTNGCVRLKDSQEYARHKSCSPSCAEEFTPPPTKGKKKKKKSTRKKRRRSPSCSPSPLKKKKKKKSSKKRKRNRFSSKKRRHSSSSPKGKRKEERKHKKHSRSHHRNPNAAAIATAALAQRAPIPSQRAVEAGREPDHGRKAAKARWKHSRHSLKSPRKSDGTTELTTTPFPGCTPQNDGLLPSTEAISKSGCPADLFKKAEGRVGRLAQQNGEPHEYDSGNDTSSPPSTQTSASRSKGAPKPPCDQVCDGFSRAFSSGKVSRGSSSDSGNSFTSCFSRTKGATLDNPSPSVRAKDERSCARNDSTSSRSSPESDHSHLLHHKAGSRSSHSRSCSIGTRSYSRSPSYSPKSCKRSPGRRSSRQRRSPSYARYSPIRDREQDHKYGSSEKESHRHRDRRRRKQSYSPMRKRRRDSPSHLEARRITSARKRPIPYYRPSPSSSSPSSISSYSSWHSPFSYSPSRSRSYSSKRTSRSRSWSSSGSDRSRSGSSSGARNSRRSGSRSGESAGSYDSLRR
ncbi:serine/arginine repetitive matrix protein 4 [Lacerta agilis]|uniref:serine/arginine repetitive matrix protein 4 n=1 Tax=Lacerta agilis TaxID=80427 RepID=UPI001419DC9B|nr:serine/arginine repetitive matrix protein 4 [Lacerta agilis]